MAAAAIFMFQAGLSSSDKFEDNVKIIEDIHQKSFVKSVKKLLDKILYEVTCIDYQREMVKFLEEGYQGVEIISHPKLSYLRDQYDEICGKIYDELVKCNMVRKDTEENRRDFIGSNSDNSDLILIPICDGLGCSPLISISLILTKPYLDHTVKGMRNVLIIHKRLPYRTHFLGEN